MKRFICIILATVMIMSFAAVASASSSGSCGENVKWSISGKTLTISGNGDMYDMHYHDDVCKEWSKAGIEKVVIEEGVTSIGREAFDCIKSVTSVTISEGVKTIGYAAFDSTSLTEISLPESLKKIEERAFACTSIEEVRIPKNVSIIEREAFSSSSFKKYIVDQGNAYYKSVDGVLFSKSGKILVSYPYGKEEKVYRVPDDVRIIEYDAFASKGMELYIPESVTTIALGAIWCTYGTIMVHGVAGGILEEYVKEQNEYAKCITVEFIADDSMKSAAEVEKEINVMVEQTWLGYRYIDSPQPPYNYNGRVMIPMRAVFEALSADVTWYNDQKMIKAEKDGQIIIMQVGNENMLVTDLQSTKTVVLDCAPIIKNDNVFVPVRAVAEGLGASVWWDGETDTVNISM